MPLCHRPSTVSAKPPRLNRGSRSLLPVRTLSLVGARSLASLIPPRDHQQQDHDQRDRAGASRSRRVKRRREAPRSCHPPNHAARGRRCVWPGPSSNIPPKGIDQRFQTRTIARSDGSVRSRSSAVLLVRLKAWSSSPTTSFNCISGSIPRAAVRRRPTRRFPFSGLGYRSDRRLPDRPPQPPRQRAAISRSTPGARRVEPQIAEPAVELDRPLLTRSPACDVSLDERRRQLPVSPASPRLGGSRAASHRQPPISSAAGNTDARPARQQQLAMQRGCVVQ